MRARIEEVRSGYWFIPMAFVVGAVASAFGLIAIDRYLGDRGTPAWTYAGGPENASVTLSTIAASMITFTGLVFSITVLALQLTSSQFSPRALRNFLSDRVSQFALGTFVATFAYSFAALSAVRVASGDDPSFVPGITVTGAFLLMGASLLMFIEYIHHTAQSVRVVSIIERIANETREVIERLYPEVTSDDGHDSDDEHDDDDEEVARVAAGTSVHVVPSDRAGVIVDADLDALARIAAQREGAVHLLHPIGSYVCRGQPLLHIDGPTDGNEPWHRYIVMGRERTMRLDVAFGLRQLVDIAERALSPGVNDPTTAVQCMDRIHDLLRRMASRPVPAMRTGVYDGVTRAWAPAPSFADLVQLGTEEIRHWGHESIQVRRRLYAMFDDLLSATDDADRRTMLREQRSLVDTMGRASGASGDRAA